jgi:hypothetical protein
MSFKEELVEKLDFEAIVHTGDGNVRGREVKVVKVMRNDQIYQFQFAKDNKMDAEHCATVINSYIAKDEA